MSDGEEGCVPVPWPTSLPFFRVRLLRRFDRHVVLAVFREEAGFPELVRPHPADEGFLDLAGPHHRGGVFGGVLDPPVVDEVIEPVPAVLHVPADGLVGWRRRPAFVALLVVVLV